MIEGALLNRDTILDIIIALTGGIALGLFFYGGLWWTVRRLPTSKQPALLTMASFIVRTSVTILGFYIIMNGYSIASGTNGLLLFDGSSGDGRLIRIGVAMVGFLATRTLLLRKLGPESISVRTETEDARGD